MKKVILDCDPGHDDAIAMMLALGNPDIDLLAVTTVAGNHTVDRVSRNARAVATVCGAGGLTIAAGAAGPLVRPLRTAADIHGDSGMDGPALPEPTVPLDPRHSVDVIIETVMSQESGTVTLVPTAPLTNIAMAVRKEPRLAGRVAEVVLMGGGYTGGNVTAAAEFNILVDPEAAQVVFHAGWPVRMVPLEVTHQALAVPAVRERIAAIGTPVARFVDELLDFFGQMYASAQGFEFPPVHDPVAVAAVIDPALVPTRPAQVNVELTGTHTLGMTVADFELRGGTTPNVQVGVGLRADAFWDLVVQALSRIGDGPAVPPAN